MNYAKLAAAFLLSSLLLACTTMAGNDVPADLGRTQIFQKGQEQMLAMDYAKAIVYFRAAIERFGDDADFVLECEYNIIVAHVRSGNYSEARAALKLFQSKVAGEYRWQSSSLASLAAKLKTQVDDHLGPEITAAE